MHVTACLMGQEEAVEVGEECRTLQQLKEAIVRALPQLCIEGFDVYVGGRALDDEDVVSMEHTGSLDVVPNTRGLNALALREAGHVVNEAGLLTAASKGDPSLCALYLDAGVPIDCVDELVQTPLHHSCLYGRLLVATLLLDRGSRAIDQQNRTGFTPLHYACCNGHVSLATLLLDRGSRAIEELDFGGQTPLHYSCRYQHLPVVALLLDRGCAFDVEVYKQGPPYAQGVLQLLMERGLLESGHSSAKR